MLLTFHKPAYPLSDYVELFTYYSELVQEHKVDRLLPDGAVHLIIELDNIPKYTFHNDTMERKQKYIRSWFSGMQTEFISISAETDASMMVIRFRAAGAQPILGIPMNELNDRVIDADLLFGTDIHSLRDKLLEAPDPTSKFLSVEQWLLDRLRESSIKLNVVQYAVDKIVKNPMLESIQELADNSGYSQKQFIQLFKTYVGLTPKFFQRILRFNLVLEEMEKERGFQLTEISHQCGFYDQAHFIREFQSFSGLNPKEYLLQKGKYVNYVPVG